MLPQFLFAIKKTWTRIGCQKIPISCSSFIACIYHRNVNSRARFSLFIEITQLLFIHTCREKKHFSLWTIPQKKFICAKTLASALQAILLLYQSMHLAKHHLHYSSASVKAWIMWWWHLIHISLHAIKRPKRIMNYNTSDRTSTLAVWSMF